MDDRRSATGSSPGAEASAQDGSPRRGVFLAIFDFPLLATGYRAVIDTTADLRVAGSVEDREKLPEEVARSGADIVVAECPSSACADDRAFRAFEVIQAARPTARILAVDCRCGSEQFPVAIRAGASGFLARDAAAADVLEALRCISRGGTYLSPSVVTRMVSTYVLRTVPAAPDEAYDALSERARQILCLAAVGRTNREIAETLQLSERTVHNDRANVMEKLGFHDRVELLRYALRRGLVSRAEL
jgi:DNA-binding NarL/FixJ family response regulator